MLTWVDKVVLSPCIKYIIGADEVGTGAWAGPFVVCAVFVPVTWSSHDIGDSKKLGPKRCEIVANGLACKVVHVINSASNEEIDREGKSLALGNLYRRTIRELRDKLAAPAVQKYVEVNNDTTLTIIDGDVPVASIPGQVRYLPKADALVPAVSAASILAKAHRDKMMRELHKQYPDYDFARNVGYGTAKHRLALTKYGLTPVHRRSYMPMKKMEAT